MAQCKAAPGVKTAWMAYPSKPGTTLRPGHKVKLVEIFTRHFVPRLKLEPGAPGRMAGDRDHCLKIEPGAPGRSAGGPGTPG